MQVSHQWQGSGGSSGTLKIPDLAAAALRRQLLQARARFPADPEAFQDLAAVGVTYGLAAVTTQSQATVTNGHEAPSTWAAVAGNLGLAPATIWSSAIP